MTARRFTAGQKGDNRCMTAETKLITVTEFQQMPEPDQPGKQELLEGDIIQLPPAGDVHNAIVDALFMLLRGANERTRMERGFQMPPGSWLQPDISVAWPEQPKKGIYPQGAPMIAVEVVSPGNKPEEMQLKTEIYLRHGAAEVWIIYPKTRVMMVYKPETVQRITDTYACTLVPVTVRLSEILADID
jgi:Uma2 family endonuclease